MTATVSYGNRGTLVIRQLTAHYTCLRVLPQYQWLLSIYCKTSNKRSHGPRVYLHKCLKPPHLLEVWHLLDHLPWRPPTALSLNVISYNLWVLLEPFTCASAIIASEMEANHVTSPAWWRLSQLAAGSPTCEWSETPALIGDLVFICTCCRKPLASIGDLPFITRFTFC